MMAAVGTSPMPSSPGGKRKRGQNDQGGGRDIKLQTTNGLDDFAFLSALQESQNADGSAQTAQAALAAPLSHSQYPDSFDPAAQLAGYDDGSGQNNVNSIMDSTAAQALHDARQQHSMQKPSVGSSAWHQQRKDNHKEVERRRREVINEGIENIAKIVPGTEKNKGAILARTCVYITELKSSVQSFENERRLYDSTISELTTRNDEARRNYDQAKAESRKWQRRCREAGLNFDDFDLDLDNDSSGAGLDSTHDGFDASVGNSTNV